MANDPKKSNLTLTDKVTTAISEPGGITTGRLLEIVNETLPSDRKVVLQPIAEAAGSLRVVEAPLSKVYSDFNYDNDVVITEQTVSKGIFPGNVGIIDDAAFYTSSVQSVSSSNYYLTITDGSTTASNALFDLVYGNASSSVSSSQIMYRQMANVLLDNNVDAFVFNTNTGSAEIVAMAFKRTLYKERLDPGNWAVQLYSGSTTMSFTDDSDAATSTQTAVGARYNIISGTIGSSYDTTSYWGYAYPDLGILVFDGTRLAGSAGYSSSLAFFNNLDTVQARSEQRLKDMNFFCRVHNKEFNYSNSPSFVTGSAGEYRFSDFKVTPHAFITTIGLYNDANELLAIARTSKPVEKTFEKEAIFRVRLSFGFIPVFLIPLWYSIANTLFGNNMGIIQSAVDAISKLLGL